MPTVTWIKGATTVTFDKGIIRGPYRFEEVNVVDQQLAGGAIAAYELSGLSNRRIIDFRHPHCSKAVATAAENFKETTVKTQLTTFTWTDNSENPALSYTVRFVPKTFRVDPEMYTDPTAPRFTISGQVAVEPA